VFHDFKNREIKAFTIHGIEILCDKKLTNSIAIKIYCYVLLLLLSNDDILQNLRHLSFLILQALNISQTNVVDISNSVSFYRISP